ncbi:MAG: DUF938 domain-containing protein [Deltaproteobacteria bacterium]|nr:DUF938 domain-containing protein [Deltaproteobacteria bacterium]
MKRHSPSAERNKGPIGDVLGHVLSASGRALEVASGSGQHVVELARRFPSWSWQPTDPDPDAIASIEAYRTESEHLNIRPALRLDVCVEPWPVDAVDLVLAINMIHIAPFEAAVALFGGAARRLPPKEGLLVTYGPYSENGVLEPESNRAFDRSLRDRNPAWGIRDLTELDRLATTSGLERTETFEMPANNRLLVFRCVGAASSVTQAT